MIEIIALLVAMALYLIFVMPLVTRFLDRVFFPHEVRAWCWYEAWMLYFRDAVEEADESRRSS